jgi:photosystem II stability/assembly factor-like uncharacterized protein
MQGDMDNPYAAIEFRYNMLKGNKPYLDPSARLKAIKYTKEFLLNNKKLEKTNTISSWTPIGPGNIGGRIRGIVIRPSDPNSILIGAAAGGVWKSTDGGASWLPKTDGGDPISIGCLVNNGDIVYAGTGEGWGNTDASYGGGIYKSTDFGDSWTLLSSTVGSNIWNFKNVLRMAFDPSGDVYAVTKSYNYEGGVGSYYTNGGLYESTNGGSSWVNISSSMSFSSNYFNGSDVLPFSSSTILFATQNNGSTYGGIFKTTNGGTSWTKITSGLPTTGYMRISLTQDPSNSNTVYAAIASTDNSSGGDAGLKGIYKSTDAGDNWTALTKPSNISSTGNLSYLGTQGWYGNVIAVDPGNSNNIYLGGVDMMKSTNGGSSWSQLTYWSTYYGTPYVHADHHAIAFDPSNSNIVYDGDDGGIYKSTDGGAHWTDLNNGLAVTQFYGGAAFPTGNVFYGGAQDNGDLLYGGGSDSWSEVYGGDGGYAAVDQSNSSIAYEEYVDLQIHKTTNGGLSWSNAMSGLTDANSSSLCLFISPFSMDPENSSVLISGSDKVWVTVNGAGTWTKSSSTLSSGQKVSAVTVVNSGSPYMGFAGTTDGKIFKCTSLTGSSDIWTEITPPSNNGAYVRRIVVDQNNKQHIYACYSGYNNDGVTPTKHVFYSSDQGSNWTDISGDLPDVPVHTLVVDPGNSQDLYIGTETGVYQTTNGGSNWINTTSGMASFVPVDELVRQTGTNKLLAFTHGRGVFETTSALPVQLTNFAGTVNQDRVILSWETATEVNNYGYEIERSSDLSSWLNVGFVSGGGNSNQTKHYSYTDNNPTGGSEFNYRLKQIDNDGQFHYSDTITVKIVPQNISLSPNYPNPFNPTTTIRYSLSNRSRVSMEVFDAAGRLIKILADGVENAGNYEVKFNGENLASGIYFYRLVTNTSSITNKMLLLK